MDERELEASNRRTLIVLAAGAVLLILGLAWAFVVGKGFNAPLRAFDKEGLGRIGGESMKQAGLAGQVAAVKVSAKDEQ